MPPGCCELPVLLINQKSREINLAVGLQNKPLTEPNDGLISSFLSFLAATETSRPVDHHQLW